jgi:hypothetical protein
LRWEFEKHLNHWRDRKLSTIHFERVRDLYQDIRKTNHLFTANREVQLVGRLFNWATDNMGWTGGNPAKMADERPYAQARFLDGGELAQKEPWQKMRGNTMQAEKIEIETEAINGLVWSLMKKIEKLEAREKPREDTATKPWTTQKSC